MYGIQGNGYGCSECMILTSTTHMTKPRERRYGLMQLVRFATGRRASVSIEGVLSVTLLVAAFAAVMDIVTTVRLQNSIDRVAWAVARANALEPAPAADSDGLGERIKAVLAAELGNGFDLADFEIQVTVYDNPAGLESGTPSGKSSALLGGEPNDLVLVRLRYAPSDSEILQRLFGGTAFTATALVRNEAEFEG